MIFDTWCTWYILIGWRFTPSPRLHAYIINAVLQCTGSCCLDLQFRPLCGFASNDTMLLMVEVVVASDQYDTLI